MAVPASMALSFTEKQNTHLMISFGISHRNFEGMVWGFFKTTEFPKMNNGRVKL